MMAALRKGVMAMAENGPPDIYVDQMRVTMGTFGVNLTFSLAEPHPSPGSQIKVEEKVRLRMSLEHAKITAMMLRRQLKEYERASGTVVEIPSNVYTGLGLASEDW